MAKKESRNPENFDFYIYFGKLLEMMASKLNPEVLSKTLYESFVDSPQFKSIKDPNNISDKEVKVLVNAMISQLRLMTGPLAQELINLFKTFGEQVSASIKAGQQFRASSVAAGITNVATTSFQISDEQLRKGYKPWINLTSPRAQGSELTKEVLLDIRDSLGGKLQGVHDVIDDLKLSFLDRIGLFEENQKKARKTFADTLIEGLAKNKFIGGALSDTVRLFGFMAARWTKQHLPGGNVLAPIIYGFSEVLGQILPLVITQLLFKIPGMLLSGGGDLFKGLFAKTKGLFTKGKAATAIETIGTQSLYSGSIWDVEKATKAGGKAGGKVAGIATEAVSKGGGKVATKTAVKIGAKTLGKAVPILGAAIAGFDAIEDFKKGDAIGGILNSLTAILSVLFPVAAIVPFILEILYKIFKGNEEERKEKRIR